jgi:hypothetical protein
MTAITDACKYTTGQPTPTARILITLLPRATTIFRKLARETAISSKRMGSIASGSETSAHPEAPRHSIMMATPTQYSSLLSSAHQKMDLTIGIGQQRLGVTTEH